MVTQLMLEDLIKLEWKEKVTEESKKSIKEAYRILYRSKESTSSAIKRLENEIDMTDELRSLIDFCKSSSKGIIR